MSIRLFVIASLVFVALASAAFAARTLGIAWATPAVATTIAGGSVMGQADWGGGTADDFFFATYVHFVTGEGVECVALFPSHIATPTDRRDTGSYYGVPNGLSCKW